MGELLGQLSERSFGQARLLISVLVQYLNANDAGPGFYELASVLTCRPCWKPTRASGVPSYGCEVARRGSCAAGLHAGPDRWV